MKPVTFAIVGGHKHLTDVTRMLIDQGFVPEQLEPDFVVAGLTGGVLTYPTMYTRYSTRNVPVLALSTGDVYSDRDHLLQQLERSKMSETWGHVVTSPLDPNADKILTTLMNENYLLTQYSGRVVIARIFDTYGNTSCDSPVTEFVRAACYDKPIVVHSPGYQERTFLHVDDMLECIAALKLRLLKGGRGIYNVGHPDPISIMALAKTVQQFYRDKSIPISVVENPNPRRRWWKVPDIQRVVADTKWKPKISLRQGIWRMVEERRT